jgi:hypothetical protein
VFAFSACPRCAETDASHFIYPVCLVMWLKRTERMLTPLPRERATHRYSSSSVFQ